MLTLKLIILYVSDPNRTNSQTEHFSNSVPFCYLKKMRYHNYVKESRECTSSTCIVLYDIRLILISYSCYT